MLVFNFKYVISGQGGNPVVSVTPFHIYFNEPQRKDLPKITKLVDRTTMQIQVLNSNVYTFF